MRNMWRSESHDLDSISHDLEFTNPCVWHSLLLSSTLCPLHLLRPCTSKELLKKIVGVCGEDHAAVALTQEILVYLGMFIRSEPELFTDMLRLRVGLIRNVMVSELSRTMSCSCKLSIITSPVIDLIGQSVHTRVVTLVRFMLLCQCTLDKTTLYIEHLCILLHCMYPW